MKEIVIENGIELKKKTYYYNSGNVRRELYYLNGKLHRENNPTIIHYDENRNIINEWYFLNDEEITDDLQIMVMKGLNKSL